MRVSRRRLGEGGGLVGEEWMARRTLRSEELAGDVERFAADDDDLLAIEQLFGDGAGETAEEVSFAVHHDLSRISSVHNPILHAPPAALADVRRTYHRLEGRHVDGTEEVSRWSGAGGVCRCCNCPGSFGLLQRAHVAFRWRWIFKAPRLVCARTEMYALLPQIHTRNTQDGPRADPDADPDAGSACGNSNPQRRESRESRIAG